MWDWSGNFGLATRKDGRTTVDPAIAKALNLSLN
jgi:hypothetical protein